MDFFCFISKENWDCFNFTGFGPDGHSEKRSCTSRVNLNMNRGSLVTNGQLGQMLNSLKIGARPCKSLWQRTLYR